MNTLNLTMSRSAGYMDAYRAAVDAARKSEGNVMLTAWYDRAQKMQGPSEACGSEDRQCALSYAKHHDADLKISVNKDRYEFFFTKATGDFSELEEDALLAIHAEIAPDEFNNVQGG